MIPIHNPKNTTPVSINESVLKLCSQIDPKQTPQYVSVSAVAGSRMENCFLNVPSHVVKAGGSVQYGWMIWEHPGVLVEGIFHAVWLKPDGQLLDITPTRDDEKQILFLPDSVRKWEHKLVDNIRLPLTNSSKANFGINLSKAMAALQSKYFDGEKSAVPKDEYDHVLARFGLRPGHKDQIGPYEMCPCGSGKNFKFCCMTEIKIKAHP
ncbi:MAG: SEC-C metal-binding domain-containing protein [Verrucomicrobiota bacterium]|jgi:hypothetical protein